MGEPDAAELIAFVTNCLVQGEEPLHQPDGSWYRGLIRLRLDGWDLELHQHRWVVIGTSWQELRDQWRHTSDLHVADVTERQRTEVIGIAERLAILLGFITASEVAIAGWNHEVGAQRGLHRSTTGKIYHFRPVLNTRDGQEVRRGVELMWAGYSREAGRRNLAAVFHYLALAERDETPLELKLAILFIVLEQLKHSFATTNNYVFVRPHFHVPGTVSPTKATRRGFARLLEEMFATVGIVAPTQVFADVRNEILHSGLSARQAPELVTLEGNVIAAIREYLLRLLGYAEPFATGRMGGERAAI